MDKQVIDSYTIWLRKTYVAFYEALQRHDFNRAAALKDEVNDIRNQKSAYIRRNS
jgi:protein-arginine kinase activator protein McsA